MKTLSQIFAGKVKILKNEEGGNMEIEAKPNFDYKLKAMEMEKKLFPGKKEKVNINKFDTKKEVDINSMIGFGKMKTQKDIDVRGMLGMQQNVKVKDIDVKSMLGMQQNKVKVKEFDVRGMLGMRQEVPKVKDVNVRGIMGQGNAGMYDEKIRNVLGTRQNIGFTDNTNHIKSILGMENRLRGNTNVNTEQIGWSRIALQKGLPMFGDRDKDKVLNVFDCNPYDRKKQALIDTLIKRKVETPIGNLETYKTQDDTVPIEIVSTSPMEGSYTTVMPEVKKEPWISATVTPVTEETPAKEGPGFWTKLGKGLIATGREAGILKIPLTPEQQIEQREQARQEVIKERELAYRREMGRKYRTKYPYLPPTKESMFKDPLSEVARSFNRAGVLGASDKISIMTGMGGGGGGYRMAEMGVQQKGGTGAWQMAGMGVVKPPMEAQVEAITTPSISGTASYETPATQTEQGMVWSPYSKKYVRYPRGPYRKTKRY